MANECAMNLAAAQHLASASTKRLQRLFALKEKIREKAGVLDTMDWGDGQGGAGAGAASTVGSSSTRF